MKRLYACLLVVPLCLAQSCLDRPVGLGQPRTTNVLVSGFRYDPVNKIDLLFMIDNSRSMADKQVLFAEALPDLVQGLVNPPCLNAEGQNLGPAAVDGACPPNSAREFRPVRDIHIGVITSSLGGYGAELDCVDDGSAHGPESVDMAHLLGRLPRGSAAAPLAADTGFLAWQQGSNDGEMIDQFRGLVQAAGERGCGWEASLEAWYRFLIEPYPYRALVRQPCSANDTHQRCIGPSIDAQTGGIELDHQLLQQRAQFLRPDSLVAVVMLTDENDCSFKASGLTRTLTQSRDAAGGVSAFRGSAACDDPAQGPNSACCHSCLLPPPAECGSAVTESGQTVGLGCEDSLRYPALDPEDHPNRRCFDQKRRFGIDLLYPVKRYSNALSLDQLCPFADDLDPQSAFCPDGQGVVTNPLFDTLTMDANPEQVAILPRPKEHVFLAGIVGVPWQDLARDPSSQQALVYRTNRADDNPEEQINWRWLLAHSGEGGVVLPPEDALMIESSQPRSGINPATGQAVAAPESAPFTSRINGHEWRVGATGRGIDDLQYACTFPLAAPVTCPTEAELEELEDSGQSPGNCDCTDHGAAEFMNPLCQQTDGSYGLQQNSAKAYPGVRELQVLQAFGGNSIVASICPKSVDTNAADYGYRPAMAAIIERLKEGLQDQCYQRELALQSDGSVACIVVEAKSIAPGSTPDCSQKPVRKAVSEAVATSVRRRMLQGKQCKSEAECQALQLCEIEQLTADTEPADLESCLNDPVPQGNGWCYLDEAKGVGNPELVKSCPETSRRKLRFAGLGTPDPGTVTVVACSGATFDEQ